MKAIDLMIGDWVLYGQRFAIIKELYNGNVTILCSINEQNEYVEETYDNIEPIPITSEILEKNGFVNVENTQTSTIMYSFRDSLFRIEVYDFNHITIDSYYTDRSCDIFISSIHELQHALRLCGIEKEIEL